MDATTLQLIVFCLVMGGGAAAFGAALLWFVLRFGPKRGFWNQPAAELRPPGRITMGGMYVLAGLHVLAGLAITLFVPGAGIAMFVLLTVVAGFYLLFAHSWTLANKLTRGRPARD